MNGRPKWDWLKFWVHFCFGAVLGAFVDFVHGANPAMRYRMPILL